MGGDGWQLGVWGTELEGTLARALASYQVPADLARIVALAVTAAEAACAGREAACGAGCPHCCVLNVAVLLPEASVIAGWLQARQSAEELAALDARLAAHSGWGRWMDDEERIIRQAECPFLDGEGSCAIHPVRPLACRGVASLDRKSCRQAFSPIISDDDRLVPADLLRRAVFDTAFSALGTALRQCGLDDRSIEVGVGVRAFLKDPACGELLAAGKRLPGELWTI